MPKTPDILVLSSIKPKDLGSKLESPNLEDRIKEYDSYHGDLWEELCENPDDTLEEKSSGQELARYYLLKTAQKMHSGGRDKALWARRFTEASKEIHGETDESQASLLINQEVAHFTSIADSSVKQKALDRIIELYGDSKDVIEKNTQENEFDYTHEEISTLEKEYRQRYPMIYEEIEMAGQPPYSSSTIRTASENAIAKLAKTNPEWLEWRVTNTDDKTMFSVSSSEKTIDIPDGRPDVKTKEELLGLLLHEIGVHAARAVSGYSLDDENLATGLPDYLDFEEGFGVLCEFVANGGVVPDKLSDRYIDIALAHGVNGVVLSRMQLIELGVNRRILRSSSESTKDELREYEVEARGHVNRIFRGGTGEAFLDDQGNIKTQAVFSKDIAYFLGFPKPASYVLNQMRSGRDISDIYEFLLQGKFDPTSKEHLEYLRYNSLLKA